MTEIGLKFSPVISGDEVFSQFTDGTVFEGAHGVDGNADDFSNFLHVVAGEG